jgi:hypothetical protein
LCGVSTFNDTTATASTAHVHTATATASNNQKLNRAAT